MLILCGSYICMMDETVLGYRALLYGRRTSQYLLESPRFQEARMFLSAYTSGDQLRTYAICVGTPTYRTFAASEENGFKNAPTHLIL